MASSDHISRNVNPEAVSTEIADLAPPSAAPKRKSKKKKQSTNGGNELTKGVQGVDEIYVADCVVAVKSEAEERESSEQEAADACSTNNVTTGEPARKKKKKKKKKKPVMSPYAAEEAFKQWINATLESTLQLTDLEGLSAMERMRPKPCFFGWRYSGTLRPAHVCPQMRMPEDILRPDYASHPDGVSISEKQGGRIVPVLEGERIDIMRTACRLGREVLDIASRFLCAGITGEEIDRIVYQACVDRKIYPSPLNYFRFPKSVCVSPNEVICHGIPDCRPIEEGDIINLDVSIYYRGFHSDLNETFLIGECDEASRSLVRTAYNAMREAALMIRPGTFYRDLGNTIHGVAVRNGCSVVTQYCGHGVGELFHGPPKVPHYKKNKAIGIMKPGHVFTIEPMINIGHSSGDLLWPDNWTAVTMNGNRSAQFEHSFLVTETGVEVMTARLNTDRFSIPEYDQNMFQR